METETMTTATATIGDEELQHQLRAGFAEVLGEIKALRGETDTRFAEVQGEIKALRGETDTRFAEVLGEIKAVNARLDAQDKLLDARFDGVNQRINAKFQQAILVSVLTGLGVVSTIIGLGPLLERLLPS